MLHLCPPRHWLTLVRPLLLVSLLYNRTHLAQRARRLLQHILVALGDALHISHGRAAPAAAHGPCCCCRCCARERASNLRLTSAFGRLLLLVASALVLDGGAGAAAIDALFLLAPNDVCGEENHHTAR